MEGPTRLGKPLCYKIGHLPICSLIELLLSLESAFGRIQIRPYMCKAIHVTCPHTYICVAFFYLKQEIAATRARPTLDTQRREEKRRHAFRGSQRRPADQEAPDNDAQITSRAPANTVQLMMKTWELKVNAFADHDEHTRTISSTSLCI